MALIRTIADVDIRDRRILIRTDFNVPLTSFGRVADESRINAHLETINHALKQNARVILMSHLGRPGGKFDEKYRMGPVAQTLYQKFGVPVKLARDCVGSAVKEAIRFQPPRSIILLENLRFHQEEEDNDTQFARTLSRSCDWYVNDAFSVSHRVHASTVGITKYLPAVIGLLMKKELLYSRALIDNPKAPFVAIVGGSKVSSKLEILHSLIAKVDALAIGGAMAYTFLKAQGISIGRSKTEDHLLPAARNLIDLCEKQKCKLILPLDHIIAHEVRPTPFPHASEGVDILPDMFGVDIGPKTVEKINSVIHGAKTIFWNGPLGIVETPGFERGTMQIIHILAESDAVTVAGGGDSVTAINQSGLGRKFSHVSTGGGALLTFIQNNGKMPAVKALEQSEHTEPPPSAEKDTTNRAHYPPFI